MSIFRFDRETYSRLDELKKTLKLNSREQVIVQALALLQQVQDAEKRGEVLQFVKREAEVSARDRFMQRIARARNANAPHQPPQSSEWDTFSDT